MIRLFGTTEVEIVAWTSGSDFFVHKVYASGRIVGVLHTPRQECLETTYEGTVDFGDVLLKAASVMTHVHAYGVAVPRVIACERRHGAREMFCPSWMLSEFIEGETASVLTPNQLHELGRQVRRLHETPLLDSGLPAQSNWPDYFIRRLAAKLHSSARYCDYRELGYLLESIEAAVRKHDIKQYSILHADIRPSNIVIRDGRLAALIDFANCIVGDFAYDLARARANRLLSAEFLEGYGKELADRLQISHLLDIYELDVTSMLTVVMIEEVNDPAVHDEMRRRSEMLVTRILARG